MSKLKVYSKEESSELFANIFCHAGTDYVECGCGRVHFSTEGYYDSEDEDSDISLEKLKERAANYPDKYIAHNCDSISWGYINGKAWVDMCPCNLGGMYEDFIWSQKSSVMDYLKRRIREEFERKNSEMEDMERLNKMSKEMKV
jgi:hypothetical protein